MIKVLILCLILPLELLGQAGRYKIDAIDTRSAVGTVTISDYYISICEDSVETVLPVTDVNTLKETTYYIIEGCHQGVAFRGAAMLSSSSSHSLGGGHRRYYLALYIEIRARQFYVAEKYSIYYDD